MVRCCDRFGASGEIIHCGYNPDAGDYGNVIVTAHRIHLAPDVAGGGLAGVGEGAQPGGGGGTGTGTIYALYGHLSAASTAGKQPGDPVARGDVVGYAAATIPTRTPAQPQPQPQPHPHP